jgi:hypothetical protein
MNLKEKALKGALRSEIKTLIIQEIRLLEFQQIHAPALIIREMSLWIQEVKGQVVSLTRVMAYKERTDLLKKMIGEAVDQEIERAIQLRKNRCLRCLHMRFYDREGVSHANLPIRANQAYIIGCDRVRPTSRVRCRRFVEGAKAISLEDYLNKMTHLYEFRELINRIEEIWKEYLTI